ncbi:hypothetical protein [Spirillospora sp. NPDC029432]|uniref:hypothetical protein n=1 Tax=Spirillospora sp. NPDC029432 TaxID=3154599 RepID=UPI0034549D63
MISTRRLALTGVTALALVAAAPAVASADVAHTRKFATASHQGAVLRVHSAHVGADGRIYYHDTLYWADSSGAGIQEVTSGAR